MNREEMTARLGWMESSDPSELIEFLNLKLAALGKPIYGKKTDYKFLTMSASILANMREKNRLLMDHLPPVDRRIQDFLDRKLACVFGDDVPRLPTRTVILERHGLARCLSLPPDRDSFRSDIIFSYRVKQGVLHNPHSDRRTTEGVFHIADTGFTVPADKKAVPVETFARLFEVALKPPEKLTELPFTDSQEAKAKGYVSLLLKPLVVPGVDGFNREKRMEIRFFAPGNLVSNLDFVESIFGNGGDPFLPENDLSLDPQTWTGTTGCVILAPHLTTVRKKDVGLPHVSKATERQKREGMCWESEDEFYNNGGAFKVTCRDKSGVVVTLIADNYFGYCKKEVKTQIGFSANVYGMAEEEHAGGAIAYPSYDLGESFNFPSIDLGTDHTFDDTVRTMGDSIELKEGRWAVDKNYPDIVYLPEKVSFDLPSMKISWHDGEQERSLKFRSDHTYVLPSGYKVVMHRPAEGRRWRLIGTVSEGIFCHKPCTVSGGGKSEISKSIGDAILHGSVMVTNFHRDFDEVEKILYGSYGSRHKDPSQNHGVDSRRILSPRRSLGSVIKLFTPSEDYTDEYNAWLRSIPFYIKDLVFLVKRFYKEDWGDLWRERFTVDDINGKLGNELKYRNNYIRSHYLRVGYNPKGGWRTFSLRKDFNPAAKIQTEDDISASVVVPKHSIAGPTGENGSRRSLKFIENCEFRLFQRPDDAIVRGYDKTTEVDFAGKNRFFSNYEPLTREHAQETVEDAIRFSYFTQPMQRLYEDFLASDSPDYLVSTSQPRIVDGKPTKNPRYLQDRPDLQVPRETYVLKTGTRLKRRIPVEASLPLPVNAVLAGRRNNPPEPGIRPLAVFNPIHYQELPELFMDFVASLTGKSPSTTGAGSEGALTKGPFNALPQIVDLNNALVSYVLTQDGCFSSAAGYVGPNYKVDHDISLLVPELWSRLREHEREPDWLIEHGYMDRCEDFTHKGEKVMASRLGWRINQKFARDFLGRVFSNPVAVFSEDMLKPELQDMEVFVDGVLNIVQTQRRVAELYFEDGTIELACPPLKALLHIMKDGHFEGRTIEDPSIRSLFSYESVIHSDWYRDRLAAFRESELRRLNKIKRNVEVYLARPSNAELAGEMKLIERLIYTRRKLEELEASDYFERYTGSLGTDPCVL
jgi:phosphoenolpyruvate carboxykinase (diphosphate)